MPLFLWPKQYDGVKKVKEVDENKNKKKVCVQLAKMVEFEAYCVLLLLLYNIYVKFKF